MRKWLRHVESLTKILKRYGDKDSLRQLSELRKKLGDMLGAVGLNEKGRDKMRESLMIIFACSCGC